MSSLYSTSGWDSVCGTCLSSNRALNSLTISDLKLLILFDINIPNNSRVCWECKTNFKKIHLFLQKVRKAVDMLLNQSTIMSVQSLSNLKTVNAFNFSLAQPALVLRIMPISKTNTPITQNQRQDVLNNQQKPLDSVEVTFEPPLSTSDANDDQMSSIGSEKYNVEFDPKPSSFNNYGEGDSTQATCKTEIKEEVLDTSACKIEFEDDPLSTTSGVNSDQIQTKICVKQEPTIDERSSEGSLEQTMERRSNPAAEGSGNVSNKEHLSTALLKSMLVTTGPNPNVPEKLNILYYPASRTTVETVIPELAAVLRSYREIRNHKRTSLDEKYFPLFAKEKTLSETSMVELRKEARESPLFKSVQFKCGACLLVFDDQLQLDQHKEKHSVELSGDKTCEVCSQCFKTEDQLTQHKESHYKCFECVVCGARAFDECRMWRHFHSFHHSVIYPCTRCLRTFRNRSAKNFHMFKSHNTRVQVCLQCGMQFRYPHNLKKHMETVHKEKTAGPEDGMVNCTQCYWSLHESQMTGHVQRCHGEKSEDPQYCDTCKKFFKNKSSYSAHVKGCHKRSGSGVHQCPHCTKKLSTENMLKLHIVRIHSQKKFICDHCQQEFTTRYQICVHLRKHSSSVNKTRSVCDICGKVLRAGKTGMRQHRNSHLGIRPYSCEYCGDTFTFSGARYTHIRLKHKGLKRYSKTPATKDTANEEGKKSEKDDTSESVLESKLKKSKPKMKQKIRNKTKVRKGRIEKEKYLEDNSDNGL